MIKHPLLRSCGAACAVACLLTACGGGGTSAPPVATKPVPPVQLGVVAEAIAGASGSGTFGRIIGFAADAAGNYYVADAGHCAIRKITPARAVTTLAGLQGQCGYADGAGAAARFSGIVGMSQDIAGNLYVAEKTTVRKVTPSGVVTTLAGTPGTMAKTDGKGAAAAFLNLRGIAIGPHGHLLVSDGYESATYRDCSLMPNTLRSITPQGLVETMPGTGGVCGDGTRTALSGSGDVEFDVAGTLYAVNYSIARRTLGGEVSYLVDTQGRTIDIDMNGHSGVTLAPDDAGNLFFVWYGEVYRFGADRVLAKAVARTAPVSPADITPTLPVQQISALTYIGNHRFLASFDGDRVVLLTLK